MSRLMFTITLLSLVVTTGAFTQINPTGTLSGTVTDPTGAVVPHAGVQVTETATQARYSTVTGNEGDFVVGNLPRGTYNVSVSAPGFQTAVYQSVVIAVGQTYDLKAVLKVGDVATTVNVEAGQQLMETVQSSVGTDISGPVITHLPSTSNSALWGVTMMSPAIQTIGGPRQSSAEGLPGGAVNITYDGIAAQWQPGKSGDPLFTMIYTNIDDVAETSISTAATNASDNGEGAVQIKFVSPRGTNQFHGGAWEYFRNDDLNSNYYFNNLAGVPRQQVRNNQYGAKVGGPIVKDKLFFFADFTIWSRPQGVTRTRTILTPAAAQGVFTYAPTSAPGSTPPWVSCNQAAGTCTAKLLQMAGNFGGTSQVDKVMNQALAAMQSALTAPGAHLQSPPSFFQQALAFTNSGTYTQQMPDFRLDWTPNSKHSAEFDYHLTRFVLNPDILNQQDFTYPVAPYNTNEGGYFADRQIFSWAWRWNLGANKSNELRFGFQTSPESFAPNLNQSIYPVATTNLGTIPIQPTLPSGLVDNPWLISTGSRDNPGVGQLTDNLVWSKGKHNMAFGFTASRQHYADANYASSFGQVSLGLASTDPMAAYFTAANLPGMSPTDMSTAEQLYGMLAGRVTGYSGSVSFDPATRQFQTGRYQSDHYHQTDFGIYATDSWRVRPNLTVNYGLRWQYEGVPVDDLNQYFTLQGGYAGLWGVSGVGNLFTPGTMTGSVPTYVLDNGRPWYNNWYGGFAPNAGIAWQPSSDSPVLRAVLGKAGDTVLRGGYSIAYSREGLGNWVATSNPGYTGQQFTTPVSPGSVSGPGEFAAGSLQLQSLNLPTLAQNPSSFQSSFPIDPTANNSVNVADPNLHMPMIQSWSLGIQRSIGQDTVVEVRYVGNHGVGLWENLNLNEVNIFENGFLTEFNNALGNLNICQANASACTAAQAASGVAAGMVSAANFANWGLPGQKSLPIFTGSFTGQQNAGPRATSQADPNFASGAFLTPLLTGQAGTVASTLSGLSYWPNLMAAGYPRNFWMANPDAQGGAFLLRNGFQSTYNAMVIDVRRRPAKGLTFDANYTWAHALTDDWQRNGSNSAEAFMTLRDSGLMKGPSPYDIRQAVKIYAVYELPFGPGHRWASSSRLVNQLIGGWEFNSNNRWQTGRPTLIFGGLGGTVNQYDGGVQLNGITLNQLQSQLGVYKTTSPAPGAVWYVPQQYLGPQGQGVNTQYISPCSTPGQFCGRDFLWGPTFFRADWALQKTTTITERVHLELRVELLNAFNTANFLWGDAYNAAGYSAGASFFSTVSGNLQNRGFGRIFTAYQDFDTTADPGGRIVQLVARISF